VSAAGLAVVALGAVGVAVAVAAGNVVAASATFAFLGAGIGLAAPSAAELIMSSAPPARAGSAAGVNETIVEASGALGVALLGSIVVGGHWVRPLPVAAAVCLAAAWGVARTLRRR
jgi:DHA2 family multidrug resistance protein-like MFS transporter